MNESTQPVMQPGARAVRPASSFQAKSPTGAMPPRSYRLLIVDLNNFASFPTLAVGILTAALRNRGHQAEVLCPLAYDVPAVTRERAETLLDHVKRRIHLSDWPPAEGTRDLLRRWREGRLEKPDPRVLREVRLALERGTDAILLSAYLQHFRIVREIAALAQARGVAVLLGGPMFNLAEVAEAWRGIPGLTAVVGAEVDRDLPRIVEAVCGGENLLDFPGVLLPDGRHSAPAAPLRDLDDTPLPDFTDFPWDRYPVRIIPIMTGRGCQWDKCLFCSDVISTSGRTFRTRSVERVLLEMQEQARRHETTNFLFLDLKLNSWPEMIRGIGRDIQRYVHGAEWLGTVHVDQRPDNGLSRADLAAAVAGGMRRISFGLESGSQRLLDTMRKGCSAERNSVFIKDAHAAGLSIRCTMFKGFPGETEADMNATADFLEAHLSYLDRVRFNNFTLHTGTPIWRAMQEAAQAPLEITALQNGRGHASYRYRERRGRGYRRAKARALAAVYAINRRPLRDMARQFDGLM
jgi:anaerobic magnesium-protoporphyrin IX monomethyl ester cyclase